MSDKTELLSCPFCGGEASVKRGKTVMVSCTVCTSSTFQTLMDPVSAIDAWNRRATIQPTAAEPVAEVVQLNRYHIGLEWLNDGAAKCNDGDKLYLAPVAPADAVRDAERYRYLRATTKAIRNDAGTERIECTPEQFDVAIDAGMKSIQKEPSQ